MSQRLALLQSRVSCEHSDAYIVAAKRTPIGSYMGSLSSFTGPQLAGICIKAALESIKAGPQIVEEVILGNVLSAGVGQAPARQAAQFGGLPNSVTCTTINKVCSSAMKSIIFGAQSIALGNAGVVVAGGFESMSNAPHMIMNARKGVGHGDRKLVDHLTYDGLTDPFKQISMGLCAEGTASEMRLTRERQDEFCKISYQRHIEAVQGGLLKEEIVPVDIPSKGKSKILDKDEEATRYKEEAVSKLKSAFKVNGTITSANASKINDGACCVVLMSKQALSRHQIKPLARIVAYADYEMESVDFCKSPFFATEKALRKAGLTKDDIDFFEFNEAFTVVPLAMIELLRIPLEKVNVLGGAVAMGHPIGMSGARIVQSLLTTLKLRGGRYGVAAICNGGGGSSAMVIQYLP